MAIDFNKRLVTNINFDKHFVSTTSFALREISAPLRKLNILYFSYNKLNADGSSQLFSTHPELEIKFFDHKLYETMFCADYNAYSDSVCLWSELETEDLNQLVYSSSLDNGLVITKKHNSYAEFFFFALDKNVKVPPSFYLSRLNYLYNFIEYFLETAKDLVLESQKHRIYYPNGSDTTVLVSTQENTIPDMDSDQFKCTPKSLTKRELECLHWCSLGKTYNEISIIMNISERTVKAHVFNIKEKLNCRNGFQLGAIYEKYKDNIFYGWADIEK